MHFDPDNHIVKRCARGMSLEGRAMKEEAREEFQLAWKEASNDFEKFIAAHYLARHQDEMTDKLKWDLRALEFALALEDEGMKASLPSLYLNIAKCYEDLYIHDKAKSNYQLALSFAGYLSDDGYGKMIKSGIAAGLERIQSGNSA